MTEADLDKLIQSISPIDTNWLERAQERQLQLTKPPGSLGRLEEIANRICAIQQNLMPSVGRASIHIFASDHGVCEEGVNAYPQSVTRQMVANFIAGGAAVNALANAADANLYIIDVGTVGDSPRNASDVNRKISGGTRNICTGPAMSKEQALEAIALGFDCVKQAVDEGAELLVCGEMGIGNTTVASALCAALTGCEPSSVCGRGAAADDNGIERKLDAVTRALRLHTGQISSPLEMLACLGGFEIAAMCGFYLGGASLRRPLLLDGFIATVAAALAMALQPAIRGYMIAGHQSTEPGHAVLLKHLHLRPLLQLDMRLGEGTGAAVAIPLVRAAVAAFCQMATFKSAGVSSVT